jgi:hypothetical protein
MRIFVTALLAFVLSTAAHAEWYRASSEHFLIYSEQQPQVLKQFAEKLERFDSAVRVVRGMDDLPPSQGNRVTIFMVSSPAEVQRLAGDKSGTLEGFYKGRASGSVAFVARTNPTMVRYSPNYASRLGGGVMQLDAGTDTILLHEYSHHLMMQAISTPYPEWLVEGFAEFMSTAKFESDGSVGLGLPATHRLYWLVNGDQLPLETLLSGHYDNLTVDQRESLYGRGWLLAHYLTFEPSRKGQLQAYLAAMASGADPLAAARQSFGDLAKLQRDIEAYLRRSSLPYLKIPASALHVQPVSVSQLSPGASAVVPLLIEVKNGVPDEQADGLATKVRAVAAQFPGDQLVQETLAEAELDSKNPEAAEAGADRALKMNPRDTEAMVIKGRALADRAEKAAGAARHALFDQARSIFIAANRIDTEDPEPLMEFYHAFVREGVAPSANAISALHYASDLAPQDTGLRMTSAMQYLIDGKVADGRRALAVIAYDPHGGDTARSARQVLAKVNAGDLKGALESGGVVQLEGPASR